MIEVLVNMTQIRANFIPRAFSPRVACIYMSCAYHLIPAAGVPKKTQNVHKTTHGIFKPFVEAVGWGLLTFRGRRCGGKSKGKACECED